jgi:hypothetical protein
MIYCIKLTCPWYSQNASRHKEKYVSVFMNHCTKCGPVGKLRAGKGED